MVNPSLHCTRKRGCEEGVLFGYTIVPGNVVPCVSLEYTVSRHVSVKKAICLASNMLPPCVCVVPGNEVQYVSLENTVPRHVAAMKATWLAIQFYQEKCGTICIFGITQK